MPAVLVQESVPLPSVLSTCPDVPSVFGIVIAPAVIEPLVLTLVTEVLPNCIVLLAATLASYPTAVALVSAADATSAAAPITVLLVPVVFVSKAAEPRATLLPPVVFSFKAS